MSETLITLARFASVPEAGLLRSRLEDEGIRAVVQGSVTRDMLSYYGTAVNDVQLQVAERDAASAREILGIGDDGQPSTGGEKRDTELPPWTCPRCGNRVENGFEICWSCGTVFNEQSAPAADWKRHTVVCRMCGADVPTTCIACQNCGEPLETSAGASAPDTESPESDAVEETLGRAWRAAIFGIVLLPPILNIYSLILLGRYRKQLSQSGRKATPRAAATLAINAFSLIGSAVLWLWVSIQS